MYIMHQHIIPCNNTFIKQMRRDIGKGLIAIRFIGAMTHKTVKGPNECSIMFPRRRQCVKRFLFFLLLVTIPSFLNRTLYIDLFKLLLETKSVC